jgi:carbon-monoxide dehydrogenase medium subunit
MKPAPFAYVAPRSLDEAFEVLAAGDEATKILAGGQSLIPLLNMRLASPARLVDLGRVKELAYVRERDGGYAIGAMTRQSAVERDERITRDVPLLAEAIRWVGHPQIRNRGTVGGSIAHGDPAAELPAVAVCLDARVTVQSRRGVRTVDARDLYLGYLATTLEPDEIVTEVWLPKLTESTGYVWLEFARRHGDYAIAGVGVAATVQDEAIVSARLALTGVGGTPVRASAAEAILAGARLVGAGSSGRHPVGGTSGAPLSVEPARLRAAVEALRAATDPDDDVQATAQYRRHLAGVLAERALLAACERARATVSQGAAS